MSDTFSQFEIRKVDLSMTRWVDKDVMPLQEGEVRLKIGTTAMTANNVTYGLLGDRFGYWNFFPASEERWGIIPVWGFADVIESRAEEVSVGERIYGYYPMASQLTVLPIKVKPGGFVDGSTHRKALPAVYNAYDRMAADPVFLAEQEPYRSLFVPLAATAYGLADWLQKTDYQGAEAVLCVSASSKTALSTAMMLKAAGTEKKVIGLTSSRNRGVVEELNVYDMVLTYDEIDTLDTVRAYVMVDFAGNGEVTAEVHRHLGDQMRHNAIVGASHTDAPRKAEGMNEGRSEVFFMPAYAAQRIKETDGQFRRDMRDAAGRVTMQAATWMQLDIARTRDEAEDLFHTVREGRIPSNHGGIIEFDKMSA